MYYKISINLIRNKLVAISHTLFIFSLLTFICLSMAKHTIDTEGKSDFHFDNTSLPKFKFC